jgi:DNA polymerase III epsilon subunit-like protein
MPPPNDLESYEECQIVSMAWALVSPEGKIMQQEYYMLTQEGEIPAAATKIHGITTEEATKYGYSVAEIVPRLMAALKRCQKLVAYNIAFDYNVLKSTLIRHGHTDAIEEFDKKDRVCVMLLAQDHMAAPFWPKLGDAYRYVFNRPIQDAHNAMGDVISAHKLYLAIKKHDEPKAQVSSMPV